MKRCTLTTKAIVFDLDYTLYDAGDFYRSAFREIATDLARRHRSDQDALDTALCAKWNERTSRYPWLFDEFLAEQQLPVSEVPRMIEQLHSHTTSLHLYPDAEQFLDEARTFVKLGVVTDGNGKMQRNKVRALELVKKVDEIVFTADGGVGWRKPSPLPFRAVCDQLGVEPEEAIYIGDNPKVDGVGPARIGMPAYRIRRGQFQEEPLEHGFVGEIVLLTDLFRGALELQGR